MFPTPPQTGIFEPSGIRHNFVPRLLFPVFRLNNFFGKIKKLNTLLRAFVLVTSAGSMKQMTNNFAKMSAPFFTVLLTCLLIVAL